MCVFECVCNMVPAVGETVREPDCCHQDGKQTPSSGRQPAATQGRCRGGTLGASVILIRIVSRASKGRSESLAWQGRGEILEDQEGRLRSKG